MGRVLHNPEWGHYGELSIEASFLDGLFLHESGASITEAR